MEAFIVPLIILLLLLETRKSGKKQHDRQMDDASVTPEHFIIRQHIGVPFQVLLGIGALFFLAIAVICAYTAERDEKWLSFIFALMGLAALFCIIVVKMHN